MAQTPKPAGSSTLQVSVVVPTYARAERLPRLVSALEAQTLDRDRFEVVIADDASPDGTADLLAQLAAVTPLTLRVVRNPVNGGPAAARNRALAACGAPVVAFTDDDCVPQPGWLDAGLAAMGEGRRAVVGRTVPAPDQPEGPFSRTLRVEDSRFLQTCNVFYRRDDLLAAGGFDERLRAGEDTDLGLRLAADGVAVVFSRDALVQHDVRPTSLRATLRETGRWVDLPAVVTRHPHLRDTHLTWRLFWKPTHPPALLAAAGLLAAAWRAPAGGAPLRRTLALLATLPWLRRRWRHQPLASGRRQRAATLPGALAVDLLEVVTMVRGSIRHRTVVL